MDRDEYFESVVAGGFDERKEKVWLPMQEAGQLRYSLDDYSARITREFSVMRKMGFQDYFLITWDFIKYAKENGIPVGPGRGSAAGSLVAYCLGITDIDPLQYDLLFERFLNPERISMPDIDIDFCIRGRGDVINHVTELYGRGLRLPDHHVRNYGVACGDKRRRPRAEHAVWRCREDREDDPAADPR
jgi:DNA polymerase-3 subunit alpha